jgi:hypothetical protein
VLLDILLQDRSFLATARYVVDVEVVLGEQLAHRRTGATRACALFLGGLVVTRTVRRVWRAGRGASFGIDHAEHVTVLHGIAAGKGNRLDDTRFAGNDFQHHLVGFEIDDIFIDFDAIADLLVPVAQGPLGDGLR